jgi:hypothetical protein
MPSFGFKLDEWRVVERADPRVTSQVKSCAAPALDEPTVTHLSPVQPVTSTKKKRLLYKPTLSNVLLDLEKKHSIGWHGRNMQWTNFRH